MSAHPTLTSDDHVLLLVDHQFMQVLTVRSHDPALVMDNALAAAKMAKLYGVPTLLTTGFAERQALVPDLLEVFPDQEPIDRATLNAFEDERVVEWVKATGRRRIVLAGLATDVCAQLSVLSALEHGYEVFILGDASGAATLESHQLAVSRMTAAGAVPLSTWGYLGELQRSYTNAEMADQAAKIVYDHGGQVGIALKWASARASAAATA